MIRAADDFDAIHAALQQLRGRRENSPLGVLSEVDVQWYYYLAGNYYGYKAFSDRAKSKLDGYFADEQGFVKFGSDPQQVKKILQIETFLFEEVPAP